MLLDHILMLRRGLGKGCAAVKTRLMAVRHFHLASGAPDPLADHPRVWMALKALKREQGAPVRKLPVSPEMLAWIVEQAGELGDAGTVIEATASSGYFFLLRGGEYVGTSGIGWDPRTILLGRDVEFGRGGCSRAWGWSPTRSPFGSAVPKRIN